MANIKAQDFVIKPKEGMMRAAFKCVDGNIRIKDIKLRPIRPDEIRLKVEACGVCGTDLHQGGVSKDSQFGHEIAGEILELGSAVCKLRVGDKVVLDSSTPCGRCANCRDARQELCSDIQSFFCLDSFGFAEEMIAPTICAIPYSGLSPEVASLQEPLGVAIDVFRLSDISVNSNVLVMGQGPIGLVVTALARRAGARRVFASGFKRRSARQRLAMKFGADAYVDPSETPVDRFDFGCAIDRIIVTSPPASLPSAFAVAAKGAIVSFIGIGGNGKETCAFNADAFHFKKLQLRASFASPALFGPMALGYLKEGVIDGEAIVTHRFKLDDMAEAMRVAAKDPEAAKVVVTP